MIRVKKRGTHFRNAESAEKGAKVPLIMARLNLNEKMTICH